MLRLKKFLFKGEAPALSDDLREALAEWRSLPAPGLDEAHFLTRYIVIDIASTGMNPERDELLGVAASALSHSTILPDDALFIDLAKPEADAAEINRRLVALLRFAAKGPLVTYHVAYVSGFLQRAFKEHLGVNFQPRWIDMAWLLPTMFGEKGSTVMPLDHWIEAFGLDGGSGRRSAMENTLLLARIFQMLLVRAAGKGIDTAARLIDESGASTFLRRTH